MEPTHLIPLADLTQPFDLAALFADATHPLEIEIGSGNGRFLAARAAKHPEVNYIGIERMLPRVRKMDKKATRLHLDNVRILRLEAFYTFYYLLPIHGVRTVYVFFPDPWPKRKHHSHRLFAPKFLEALWMRLVPNGTLQLATDDADYFAAIQKVFAANPRFAAAAVDHRPADEQTDFELLFRGKGLPIGEAAYRALPDLPELSLAPLTIPEELLPRGEEAPGDTPP